MSRSYSASTRKRLWRLVISTARPGLPRCVGGEKSVGREDGGPGRPCQPVSISGLAAAHQGTRRSISPFTSLHSFKD